MMIDMSNSDSLTERERAALLSFLGYGNPEADFVFVGMEEGLTETETFRLSNSSANARRWTRSSTCSAATCILVST